MRLSKMMKRMTGLVIPLLLGLPGCQDHPVGVAPSSAPAPITDLRASVPTDAPYASTIRLHWTAPAGPTLASQYEVRAADAPLAADQWLDVDPAVTLRAVQPPGAEETVVVSGLQQGRIYYFVVRSASDALVWSAWSNVASLPTLNMPPVAAFTVGPDSAFPDVPITVDASGSTDFEDDPETLEVRWDWEDDGTWDTEWTTVKTASHLYASPDLYTVRLEVRDHIGGTGQAVHRVARGPVLIRSAYRLVGYLEEVYNCNPSDPLCYPAFYERKLTTRAYGPVTMSYYWTDQTSLVDVDTLRFDGVIRSGIAWPNHSNWVNYDVTFVTCAPVEYRLSGQTDTDNTSLILKSTSGVLYALDPGADGARDFMASGRLETGTFRLVASVGGWIDNPTTIRMRFEMTFEPAPPALSAP